jgi:arginase
LIEGGAVELLRERSISVTVEEVDRAGPFCDTASSSAKVSERLAAAGADAVKRGALPIVLTGSCNSCLGVLAGFEHARCGAVWIDAHADFNTPESAASGSFPGMSLAIATGHRYRSYWSRIGDSTPVAEENVALFGTRDLWPRSRGGTSRALIPRGRPLA